jgi:hypothetical protein
MHRTRSLSHEHFRDQDPTPRASIEPWRFTPSLLDPSAFSFTNFASQPPGNYTATPGGTNTLYHPQAGDLHTPSIHLGMGLGAALSMPTTEGTAHHPGSTTMDVQSFHHGFHPHHFHNFNPFAPNPAEQPSFTPSLFVHQDTGYETMDHDGSPLDSGPAEDKPGPLSSAFHGQSPEAGFQSSQYGIPVAMQLPSSGENFRFHATLNAPTAMIKHADEISVTYLNKGQAYSLSIVDTKPTLPIVPGTSFRTFVRISFEDEQQRKSPGSCWSLWKEGRGTNEAHQRGGKLQAVEYVEAGQPADGDDKRTRVELETCSFDGFSVIWTPGVNGAVECNVAVRFNFLSTDFSHSKGVKGIPVRLCAKTSPLPSSSTPPMTDDSRELCFCKVKLFRDHGAERKLSNDVAHIKKTIDKMKQQIAQAESGMKDFSKRKRSVLPQTKGQDTHRPGKAQKHKRTWSMSSTSSAGAGGARLSVEEDLHSKLQTLQDMFTSTRPVSILCLRGDPLDDPDLHPVILPGESLASSKAESRDNVPWQSRQSSVAGSSFVSPSPSSLSLQSQTSMGANSHWQEPQRTGQVVPIASHQGSGQPTRVKRTGDAGNLNGWIEALDVDSLYRPPPERATKPVACFYVARRDPSNPSAPQPHRAVYLMERTLHEFVNRVSAKCGFDANKVVRIVHVLQRGLEVEIDDDVIQALSEGLDMELEVVDTSRSGSPVKGEWEMVVDIHNEEVPASPPGYELRFMF